MINCPCCQSPVTDWSAHRVAGRLLITFRHCDRSFTAETDFFVTEIREGLRLIRT